MKITVQSTTKTVEVKRPGQGFGADAWVPARIWEGTTDTGIPVTCFITRIAPDIPNPPQDVCDRFAAELEVCDVPKGQLAEGIPLRFIL